MSSKVDLKTNNDQTTIYSKVKNIYEKQETHDCVPKPCGTKMAMSSNSHMVVRAHVTIESHAAQNVSFYQKTHSRATNLYGTL